MTFLIKNPIALWFWKCNIWDLLSFWQKLITLSFSKVMYQINPSQWYLVCLRNKWHSLIPFNILFSLIHYPFFNNIRILKCICTSNITLIDEILIVSPKICHLIQFCVFWLQTQLMLRFYKRPNSIGQVFVHVDYWPISFALLKYVDHKCKHKMTIILFQK